MAKLTGSAVIVKHPLRCDEAHPGLVGPCCTEAREGSAEMEVLRRTPVLVQNTLA